MMATLAALLKAKGTLMAPRAWHTDEAVRRAVGALNIKIDATRVARDEAIARHGALKVTSPWRRGQWQPGEDYEYEPRIPIYDNSGEEIFSLDAGGTSASPDTVLAMIRANDIVKAVNMHERLVACVEAQKIHCQERQDVGGCEGCFGTMPGGRCDILALLKEAKE